MYYYEVALLFNEFLEPIHFLRVLASFAIFTVVSNYYFSCFQSISQIYSLK